MFGSLILPTGVKAAVAGTRTGGGIHPRDQLCAAMGSIPYHPIMSMSFPSRNNTKSPARASSFTADTLPLSKPNTTLNLYQILRIKHTASSLEIKTAYRKLAKQFHPDASPQSSSSSDDDDDDDGGGRDFMEIHNAYATLSDPTERARYDLSIQIQSSSSSSHRRYYSSTSVDGMQTRRWETDQCW